MGNVCDKLEKVEKHGSEADTSTQDMRKAGVDLKSNNGSRAERRWVDQRRFNKEKKRRLRVLNIYDHNAYMRLDKKHEAEGIAKIYKETNKELKEWRASI
jgi:hypothetical protein